MFTVLRLLWLYGHCYGQRGYKVFPMVERTHIFRYVISPHLPSSRLVSPQSISVNFEWIWMEIYERNDSVNKQVAVL